MRKTAIFGASGGGQKVAQTLESYGLQFDCFVDNSQEKWGTFINGKLVIKPSDLYDDNYSIIIASEHQAEIETQLKDMGLFENIILKEDLLLPEVMKQLEQLNKEDSVSSVSLNDNRTIILELSEGVQLGGIETWSYMVAELLQDKNLPIEIWAKKTQMEPPEKIKTLFHYHDIEYFKSSENVIYLAKELIKKAPCSVIINKQTQLMYAAMLAKKVCPEGAITIVSIIHNDNVALYRRQKRLEEYTDHICCVSSPIMQKLTKEYGIDKNKVTYKESPVKCVAFEKNYTLNPEEPVKIGYAARITKYQKRADLLVELVNRLVGMKLNVEIEIAGDGNYLDKLKNSIDLSRGNVKVLGNLSREKIQEFWRKKDIFINVSDFEGVGLSMLEAMSNGVVPIETKVAGADEFIENDVNGYYVPVGDVESMIDEIKLLIEDRQKMQIMGRKSRKIVQEKCNPKDYVKYLRQWLKV